MLQAYIVTVELPYGQRDVPAIPEGFPSTVAVLAESRSQALAFAADALESKLREYGLDLRGLEIGHVYPIVQAQSDGITVAPAIVA